MRPIEWAPNCLSLEDVVASVCHKVSMEVDDNILLIVGDAQGILDQQLSTHPFHLIDIF